MEHKICVTLRICAIIAVICTAYVVLLYYNGLARSQIYSRQHQLLSKTTSKILPAATTQKFEATLQEKFQITYFDESLWKENRTFWKSVIPKFKCPESKLSRVGNSGDGGKWTCGLNYFGSVAKNRKSSCVVYSFGVKTDSSFEAAVLATTRCSVYAYDPAVDHIAAPVSRLNPRVHFFKMGVGGNNTNERRTLKTMMEENGSDTWIDILKMDVEGDEFPALWKVFEDFEQLPFGQLLLEVHRFDVTIEDIVNLVKDLEERGLRMFSIEINNARRPFCCSELSFINLFALENFLDVNEIQKLAEYNPIVNPQLN